MKMGWRVEQPVGEEAKSKLPRGLSQRREERGLEKVKRGEKRDQLKRKEKRKHKKEEIRFF